MIGIRGRWSLLPAAGSAPMRLAFTAVCWIASLALSIAAQSAVPTDVILVLDNSDSMRENDPEFLAKRAVSKFVSALDQDTRAGILIFDQKVDYAVPLTELTVTSRGAIQSSLEKIDYRGQFTDSPAAIERAIYELKTNAREDVAKAIIFMTDGIVDTGKPEVDAEKTKWMREELAADAADSGIKVFAIAFTQNADFMLIQSLAKQTSGAYFRALVPEDLAKVFAEVNEILEAPPAPVPTLTPGPAPAALASCMAGLVPDERVAFEQMAAEAGIPAEQLCRELTGAPEGTVVVVPPDQQPAEDDLLGLIIVLALAAIILLIIVALVIVIIRKRRPVVQHAAAVDQEPLPIPDAFIKDIHGIADDPAVQLGEKPLIVGRVAGADPAHLDYFVVNKGTIGRRHAMIKYRDFSFWLIDQGSVNGTFLNGERIDGERQLKHGDRVKFHKYEFEFSMPEMDDAGHTVFADPGDVEATMIGEVIAQQPPENDVFDLTAGAAPAVAKADEDIFDEDLETALFARQQAELAEGAATDDIDSEAETGLYGGSSEAADGGNEFMTVGPPADPDETSEDEFDAEASAFFADGSMGPAVGQEDDIDFDDEGPAPATDPGAANADNVEDFSESATLLPASMGNVDKLGETSDISLDEFMRTDSFDAPVAGLEADESDDATLLPDDVGGAPAIDDVFDITGEGTIPPADAPDEDANDVADDDAGDDDEDSEGPTVFNQ